MSVKVYSTPDCPWCKKVKEFLKENKINFQNIDVSKDEEAAEYIVKKSGQRGVPVVEANGEIVVGFDEDKLKSILKIK